MTFKLQYRNCSFPNIQYAVAKLKVFFSFLSFYLFIIYYKLCIRFNWVTDILLSLRCFASSRKIFNMHLNWCNKTTSDQLLPRYNSPSAYLFDAQSFCIHYKVSHRSAPFRTAKTPRTKTHFFVHKNNNSIHVFAINFYPFCLCRSQRCTTRVGLLE